ncbi:nad-dependent protein deacetylase sirtuin-7 [Anaeramoeba flamelloides]|uniref:protein acetyllysine N-acetyltransferase n=1 Tax=Anaeramoeba flamelloides TaxID=1746091 RepID=A0AAV7YJR7_9EUKA|nr:nad-dependent protein deacetylase sirtuin-7 [Anaeramoeba flamelloides]KAJ6235976.1 nad-dependent protein deacetylase sirtuin-7 [Anaeramoeba flamelloides]
MNGVKEIFDPLESVKENVLELIKLMNRSKHIIAFTGAGISTSAGIPDYRGPNGVWTCRDQGRPLPKVDKPWNLLKPTYTHMSLVRLVQEGRIHHVISQNIDGLHLHSGLPFDKLSELHGNLNIEVCKKCGEKYFRPFNVIEESTSKHNHLTGRYCDTCNGELYDTIIRFGESLNKTVLDRAFDLAYKSDLAIVLGSSLAVHPACQLPLIPKQENRGKLVICNLQRTKKDTFASVLIRAKTDTIFKILMEELKMEVKDFNQVLHENNMKNNN